MADPTPADPRGDGYARAIVETMRVPLLVLSADLRVLWANPSFYRTFRTVPEQVEGHLLFELGQGQWAGSPLEELLATAFSADRPAQGLEVTTEFEHLGRRTMWLIAQRLRMGGEPRAILLRIEDITERTQVEAALEASEVRYRRLFETAQDGILLLDAHTGEIVDVNPFLEDLLGYRHDEMVGRKLWEMGPFKDVAAARAAFEKLQAERYVRYEDLPLQTQDGRRIAVEFVSNVYAVNGGDIIQCNIRDITERKRAEEQLHALHLQLEARVEARTAELARANLALQKEIVERERAEAREHQVVVEERTRIAREIHDTLAQGFTGIIIQLEAAEDVLAEQPEAARLHMLQARTLARESLAEARRSVWALRPLALGADDLGYAFLHLVHSLSESSGTPIGFTLCGVLRPLSQDVEHHLLRIGQEALTNALRHAHAAEIRVTLTCGADSIELTVEDSGAGFDVTSATYQGLGLRGMQERADALRGQLTITSVPGQGTLVRVVVPIARAEGGSLAEDKLDQNPDRG
ncbi:MAG: PAS domain S-box protein [Armatimonadetes bacterium]|nr:PAS domain S-box protein [Armatimonadota bacterium]